MLPQYHYTAVEVFGVPGKICKYAKVRYEVYPVGCNTEVPFLQKQAGIQLLY